MSEDFEEWLGRNRSYCWAERKTLKPIRTKVELVGVRALGKLALEKYIFLREEADKIEMSPKCKKWSVFYGLAGQVIVFKEMAVACLGEKEVERRLCVGGRE